MNWHLIHLDELFQKLGTGPQGLSQVHAEERLGEQGPNELTARKKKTLLGIFLYQFKDFMIVVLMAAAVLAGIMGDVTDTAIILAIVLVNAVIGMLQEHRAEKAIEALRRMAAPVATVVHDGSVRAIPAAELVTGDMVLLEAGQIVPADLRLVECHGLRMQEAALTGESQDTTKHAHELHEADLPLGDRLNMAFKGTIASAGRGRGLVVATGMNTEMGKIARLLDEDTTATPLQKRMAVFGKHISYAVLAICGVLFAVGYLRGEDPMLLLLTSISLAVAAIPEALPALMSVTLAISARRMVRQRSLIRRLSAVETLGSVTYICTDKTGTLTLNRMRAEQVVLPAEVESDPALREHFFQAMALSNDVALDASGTPLGDGTEVALYEHALKNGFDKSQLEATMPRIAEVPFDAVRKCMSTVHGVGGDQVLFIKGALESLLERAPDQDPARTTWLMEQADAMARQGFRVMALGSKGAIPAPVPDDPSALEQGITVLGLVGLLDPPRPEATEAVADCLRAGIRPVMITGDHPETARSIAQKIGILVANDDGPTAVISGKELAALSREELLVRVEHIRVYARVSPEQKLNIVSALQEKGHFVAMTGDGVNDAPALKRADIGVAMGITGTDVSKEAADMILLDDNFATLAHAVREGRRVFDNILKFIKYILTSNAGEIWAIALAPMIGLPIPLLPVHILWINLVTDGLPGLALSMEPGEKDLMQRPPRHPKASIFANGLGLHILWVGMLMGAVTLGTQAWSIHAGNAHWQTMAFNVLCLSQMGHVLAIRNSRSFFRTPFFSNPALLGAIVLTLLLQLAVTYVPMLQSVFHTEALSLREFLIVGAVSSIVFIGVEVEKLFARRSLPIGQA